MKAALHRAFWRRWRDRAAAMLAAAVALAPMGMPREIADWLAQQAPMAPSWLHWIVAAVIVAWRLSAARKA